MLNYIFCRNIQIAIVNINIQINLYVVYFQYIKSIIFFLHLSALLITLLQGCRGVGTFRQKIFEFSFIFFYDPRAIRNTAIKIKNLFVNLFFLLKHLILLCYRKNFQKVIFFYVKSAYTHYTQEKMLSTNV
jgi:hypothetical protein